MGIDVKNIAENFKKKTALDTFGVTKRQLSTTPQRSYLWEVQITQGGIIPVVGSLLDNITLFAKSASVPSRSIEPIHSSFMGKKIHYSGKDSSPHTFELVFWDDEAASIRRYFDQWYKMVWSENGESFSKGSHDRTVSLRTKDATDTAFTSKTDLSGCFPIDIAAIPLNYEGSDILEVSVTLQYDNFKFIT